MHTYQRQSGFTIIELMVTVAVLAILVAVAIPSFNQLIQNMRSVGLAEEIASALNLARSEALQRGVRVSMCSSNNGTACNGTWNDGFIVVVDAAAGEGDAVVVGEILQVSTTSRRAQIVGDQDFVRYLSTGRMANTNGNNPIGLTVRFEGCGGRNARALTVGLGGMVNVERAECP